MLILNMGIPIFADGSDYKGMDFYGKKQIASYIHAENILNSALDKEQGNYDYLKEENKWLKERIVWLESQIDKIDK